MSIYKKHFENNQTRKGNNSEFKINHRKKGEKNR